MWKLTVLNSEDKEYNPYCDILVWNNFLGTLSKS